MTLIAGLALTAAVFIPGLRSVTSVKSDSHCERSLSTSHWSAWRSGYLPVQRKASAYFDDASLPSPSRALAAAMTTSRRWFRFSLRTLFIALTVLGVFLGWLVVQVQWISE